MSLGKISLESNYLSMVSTLECVALFFVQRCNSSFFTKVPSGICFMTKLQSLDVSNNCIEEVPLKLGKLTELLSVRISIYSLWWIFSLVFTLFYLRLHCGSLNSNSCIGDRRDLVTHSPGSYSRRDLVQTIFL